MAESVEELKSLLMRVKEESKKPGLKFSIQNTKIMVSGPIISNRWGKVEAVTDFILMLRFKPVFSPLFFPFIKKLFSSSLELKELPLEWYHLHV